LLPQTIAASRIGVFAAVMSATDAVDVIAAARLAHRPADRIVVAARAERRVLRIRILLELSAVGFDGRRPAGAPNRGAWQPAGKIATDIGKSARK
jgi:hypothetical protein